MSRPHPPIVPDPKASQFTALIETLPHGIAMDFQCVDCPWTLRWSQAAHLTKDLTPVEVPNNVYDRLEAHWQEHGAHKAMQWSQTLPNR